MAPKNCLQRPLEKKDPGLGLESIAKHINNVESLHAVETLNNLFGHDRLEFLMSFLFI